MLRAARRRIRAEHRERLAIAWHTGQLVAMATNAPKKYPSLKDFLGPDEGAAAPAKVTPWQVMLSRAIALSTRMPTSKISRRE